VREGRTVAVETVETLRERAVRRVEIGFAEAVAAEEFATLPGVTDVRVTDGVLRCRLDGRADALVKAAGRHTVLTLLSEEPDLEEVFLTYYSTTPADRSTGSPGSPGSPDDHPDDDQGGRHVA
jgi:ABC-2 type transport system ATP-binding protein